MFSDLRYAVRRLLRAPGFVAVVLLTLALGIGANTAIFSVVDGVLLRALPYPAPDRLVVAWGFYPDFGKTNTSLPDFLDWRKGFASAGELAAFSSADFTLTGDRAPERVSGAAITSNYLHVLGIAPALGRGFVADDERGATARVVMLGHEFWRRQYGGDASVVGRTIMLNGVARTIVGIAPPTLDYPSSHDVLVPQRTDTTFNRRAEFLDVVGRLAPGVSVDQAKTTLAGVAARLAVQYPETNAKIRTQLVTLHDEIVGPARPALLVFMGAVGLVLLVACANVANLLLVRAAARTREVALIASLGAHQGRIVRQLIAESLVLAVAGGGVGVLLASVALRALKASQGASIPRLDAVVIDGRVLAFALAVSVATGLLFGIVPALRLAAAGLQGTLRAGGRTLAGAVGGRRTRDALVLAEVAMAVVLLVGAALLLGSFSRLLDVRPGFDAERVLTAQVLLPRTKYATDEQTVAFWTDLLGRVRATPGVRSAAVTSSVPFAGVGYWSFEIQGQPRSPNDGTMHDAQPYLVSDDYLGTMGISLVRGRTIDARDVANAPLVAMINEQMARTYWRDRDPIGSRVSLGGDTWWTVVGIVRDTRQEGMGEKPYAQLYMPNAQFAGRSRFVVMRATGDAAALTAGLRRAAGAIDAEVPVYDVRTMSQRIETNVARPRLTALLIGVFASVALLLAAIGIYGVVSYSVSQRVRELGVRMALGAQPTDVLRLVVRQGIAPVAWGLGVGLVGAWASSRVLSSLLYGVSATDPAAFAAAAAFLGLISVLAAYLPARRATRVDPVVTLRAD